LQAAITGAVNAGVTVVAAAGNSGPGANTVENPANCAGVIPAGASDSGDRIAGFSSRGVELSSGVVAPGVAVLTTNEGGGTSSPSGTSFSSPMTAGVAALILAAKPSFSPAQVRTALRAGADNIGSPATDQGAGRLNAYKSVYYAINNGALPAPNAVNTEVKPFAYPNPLKLSQTAGAVISVPSSLKGGTIKIYTLDGQIVRTLTSPLWNGRNDGGKLVATGTYVFTVTVGSKSSSGRMAVIR
jgi:serine protease